MPEEITASSADIQTASACEAGLHCDHVTDLPLAGPLTKDTLNLSRTTTTGLKLPQIKHSVDLNESMHQAAAKETKQKAECKVLFATS